MADIKTLWKDQKQEEIVTLENVRARADNFQHRIRLRNVVEYTAAAVVPLFAWYIYDLPGLLVKLGSGLCIAGLLFIVWQLHRRGSAESLPETTGLGLIDFHRRALIRQRDALRSVWKWYLAPIVPGFLTMMAGFYFAAPEPMRATVLYYLATRLVPLIALVFGFVLFTNRRGAKRLQKQIDQLDT